LTEMRFSRNEVTVGRVCAALKRRMTDLPHALAWRCSPQSQRIRENLARYQDIHRNERCFVIANGLSLNRLNLSLLAKERTISMNRAYLLYERWGFQPNYFVCIDELVLQRFAADIRRLRMPKFLSFNERRFFPGCESDASLLFPRYHLRLWDRFSPDMTCELTDGGTVTYACLQLAYFMGFAEVILIGLDHSFVEKGTPSIAVVRDQERDESHCHPDYFPKGMKWHLPDLHRSELAYALAQHAFKAGGRRILDATPDGKCSVFDKTDYRTLVRAG
jgi:hypothetical protein